MALTSLTQLMPTEKRSEGLRLMSELRLSRKAQMSCPSMLCPSGVETEKLSMIGKEGAMRLASSIAMRAFCVSKMVSMSKASTPPSASA